MISDEYKPKYLTCFLLVTPSPIFFGTWVLQSYHVSADIQYIIKEVVMLVAGISLLVYSSIYAFYL